MLQFSQLDWPRILYKRTTAILLGLAALLTVVALLLSHEVIYPDASGTAGSVLVSILGVVGVFGFYALLVCMGFFWLRCDVSLKANRRVWFFLLLVGFAFGTQILYYAIVYVPAVVRKLRSPAEETFKDETAPDASERRRIGPFSKVLLLVWGSIVLPTIVILVVAKTSPVFMEITGVTLFLCSVVVVLESTCHFIISIYRTGMRRPARAGRTDPSRPPR